MKFSAQISYIFIIALMELIGLGMIIPLSPYMARSFGADDLQVGLLMSIYSVVQCIGAPLWGKWSDRWGRKPVLLVSLFFTGLSYLWFAFAPNLVHLFFSRALAGAFGVTVSTSFAFISDRTLAQQRSKNMALVGAAFGLGFVIGPAIGGVLGSLEQGLSLVAVGSAGVVFMGFLFALFVLKESDRHPHSRVEKYTGLFSAHFRKALKQPALMKVLLIFFILSLALTLIEAPLFLLMKDQFHWPQSLSSLGFAYIGFILALTQGFFVRYWIPYWGEKQINQVGFALLACGLFGICIDDLRAVGIAVTLLSLGFGLSYTCLTGSVSLLSRKTEQGGALGIHQSLSSLSRILGPAIGGWMYRDVSHYAPFVAAGVFAGSGLLLSYLLRKSIPESGKAIPAQDDLSYAEMNWFQLDNLIQNQIPFSFFYLEDDFVHNNKNKESALSQKNLKLSHILAQAQSIKPQALLELDISSEKPIVLICEDGTVSQKHALKLLKKWTNVFYIKEGIQGYLKQQ